MHTHTHIGLPNEIKAPEQNTETIMTGGSVKYSQKYSWEKGKIGC